MMDDLISRAALLDEFRFLCGPQTGDGWDNMGVRNLIRRQKAVDAAPVVHGYWIYKERHRKNYRQYTGYDAAGEAQTIMVLEESDGKEPYCSECGAQAAESFMDFCPHCGAKMDGERRGRQCQSASQMRNSI